jgi:hypothetical protein
VKPAEIKIGRTYRLGGVYRKVVDMYTLQNTFGFDFTRVEYIEKIGTTEKPGYMSLRQFAKWAESQC